MSERYQSEAARRGRERWSGIGRVVFLWLLTLLISDLLCSLLVPFVGPLQIALLTNLLNPPPSLPDEMVAYATSVTAWGGRVYARGILYNTAVFDEQSGRLLSTMTGIVVGSDAQYLYVNTGKTSPGNTFDLNTLTARDSGGNIIWSYVDDQFTLTQVRFSYQSNSVALPQLLSDADNVYVLENKKLPVPKGGRLLVLNRATGAVRWSYDTIGAARFVLAQDTLVLLSDQGLTAFTVRDGRRLWRQPNNGWTTLVSDGRLLYLQNNLGMRALSLYTGKQAWQVSYKPQSDAPFVLDSGVVYLSEYIGKIIAVDTRDGRLLWRATIGDNRGEIAPLAAQNGILYTYPPQFHAAYFNDSLSAISGADGHTLWKTPLPAHNLTLIGIVHGALYFTAGDVSCGANSPICAHIFAINDQTGKQMWSHSEPQMYVAIPPQGQSLFFATLIHRNQVSRAWFGRYTYGPNCSDTVTLMRLSAIDGTVEWRNSAPFHCLADIAQ